MIRNRWTIHIFGEKIQKHQEKDYKEMSTIGAMWCSGWRV